MFRILFLGFFLTSTPAFSQPKGSLENPTNDDYSSGIYMFSGWVCEAEEVEIYLETLAITVKAAYGTERGDTQGVCGDSDNGFGLLVNMSLLGTGEHTAIAYADGQEFGRTTFYVQRLSTGEFLRGANGLSVVNNFPTAGQESWLTWVESAQNFAIGYEGPSPDPYEIAGIWWSDADNYVVSIATQRLYGNRVEIYAVGTPYDYTSSTTGSASEGYIVGNTATLFSVLPEGIESQSTMTLVDSLNAIVRVDKCISYDPNLACGYREGATIAVRKLAGPNTGRAAPQDGTPLTPIGGTSEGE